MAKWFSVTRAKAQKPQKTKAWARPGSGRSRITLAWQSTSHTKSQTRLPMGKRLKLASFFDLRILSRTVPKRRQKPAAEATASPTKSNFSQKEKCRGSAKVPSRKFMVEQATIHDRRGGCRADGGRRRAL